MTELYIPHDAEGPMGYYAVDRDGNHIWVMLVSDTGEWCKADWERIARHAVCIMRYTAAELMEVER